MTVESTCFCDFTCYLLSSDSSSGAYANRVRIDANLVMFSVSMLISLDF